MLEIVVEDLTEEQGRAVEFRCREQAAWPVQFKPARQRRFAVLGPHRGPQLYMPDRLDDGRELLGDDAEWDAPAWVMNEGVLPALAASVRLLGMELPQGFTFRATWVGSAVRQERVLTADALARIVLDSALNQFTLYRVPAGVPVVEDAPLQQVGRVDDEGRCN
jgi:hypothetical protein